ncbi:MAG: alpha/beta hydrolase [Lachnospiraceae bacterium]|nr:alpha/beta hydrolase [Lachnospiraceae bacterium]
MKRTVDMIGNEDHDNKKRMVKTGMCIKNGSVKLGDTDMYYVSFGDGDRKLVMLPGLSDGLATVKGKAWLLVNPYRKFLKDHTVYIFSRKNKMPEGYGIKDMADDQVRAMEILGIGKASVCGVSQGGMIAQCIAIYHPEVLDRLILAVTAPSANEVVQSVVSGWIEMAKNEDHVKLMTDTAEKMYSDRFLEKNGRLFPVLARFTKPSGYERFLRNADAILRFDVRNELGKITAPTLIIAGGDDKTVGNDAVTQLSERIPGSVRFVYEGLGHGAFEEAGDFYDRIFAFLRETGTPV